MQKIIGILGGGKWGTSLGERLANNCQVKLYSRDLNPTDYKKRGKLEHFREMAELRSSDLLIVAVPSFAIREIANNFSQFYSGQPVLGVSKGVEKETGFLPSQIVQEVWPEARYAHLSGPSFAGEVSQGLPAIFSLALTNFSQKEYFQEIINLKGFKIELTEDLTGVQLGGALKNVVAIATGVSDALGYGENFRALLILEGLREMILLGEKLGAKEKTFFGPSGLGDLILTATSSQSRNYRLGRDLAHNLTLKEKLKGDTYEGVASVYGTHLLSQKFNLKLPVMEGMYQIISQHQKPSEILKVIQNEICR